MHSHTLTKAVSRLIDEKEEMYIAIKEFEDGFFLAEHDPKLQASLIAEKPRSINDATGFMFTDVLLAGLIEHIAFLADIEAPKWVFDKEYYFDEPVFTSRNPEIQKIDFVECDIFYSSRNLYCGKMVSEIYKRKARIKAEQKKAENA